MIEIYCVNCPNFVNKVDGCKLYGSDPAEATKACIRDCFKNAAVQPKRIDRDKETYFRAEFYCPVCNSFLSSYTYGRAWTNNGLHGDQRVNCSVCGQMIDWNGVPAEEG